VLLNEAPEKLHYRKKKVSDVTNILVVLLHLSDSLNPAALCFNAMRYVVVCGGNSSAKAMEKVYFKYRLLPRDREAERTNK
jgi:hypothetical protein